MRRDRTGIVVRSRSVALGLAMLASGCGPSHHLRPTVGMAGLPSPLAAECDSLERLLQSLAGARSKSARIERTASSFEYRYAGGRTPACQIVVEDEAAVPSPFQALLEALVSRGWHERLDYVRAETGFGEFGLERGESFCFVHERYADYADADTTSVASGYSITVVVAPRRVDDRGPE